MHVDSALLLSYVWPDPQASAAGTRTWSLLRHLHEQGVGCTVACASSPAERCSRALQASGMRLERAFPNRASETSDMLLRNRPDVVIFDRYYAEESWSHVVRDTLPDALRVLDMQDVHGLRGCRQRCIERGEEDLLEVFLRRPSAWDGSMQRELASVLRSDLTIVVSRTEEILLERICGISKEKLVVAPFFRHDDTLTPLKDLPTYEERKHFVAIGNWDHAPNADAAAWLAATLWRRIRDALPEGMKDAELHLYGARARGKSNWLADSHSGVRFMGFMDSLEQLQKYRVMLAPLRFGAGVKGKILDAWSHGMPVVTTPIGAEGTCDELDLGIASASVSYTDSLSGAPLPEAAAGGSHPGKVGTEKVSSEAIGKGRVVSECNLEGIMRLDLDLANLDGKGWGGFWKATNGSEFALDAVKLYADKTAWSKAVGRGREILGTNFSATVSQADFGCALNEALSTLESRRARDYLGQMLWGQQYRASEYLSKWIELKETQRDG